MENYLENLKIGREVRESLAAACGLLRTNEGTAVSSEVREALLLYARHYLFSEEPKVRKNAAKLLSLLKDDSEESTELLVRAYQSENTRFVRSTYLEALENCDITKCREYFSKTLSGLLQTEVNEENRKHVNEEVAALRKLLGETAGKHRFTGYDADNTVLFVVNPCYCEMFAQAIGVVRKKVVNGGVVVRTTKLTEILQNRIWREAVFRVPEALAVSSDPYEAAKVLAGETVGAYLANRLSGTGAIAYRVDLRCRDAAGKERFLKRICQETDRLSGGKLVNVPGDYEVTFRISESGDDTYRLGVVFAGVSDNRFAYRRETVASSIHPTDAAAVIAAAKPYLISDAQVLDPFCGAGTMIAERMKAGRIRSAFGVDTFGPAIEKARGNVRSDRVWFVHRDFFDYRQDHRFDEIITNMPFGDADAEQTKMLYRRFFRRLPEHLRENGTLVMISHDPKIAEASIPSEMDMVAKIPMRERGEMAAYIIRFRQRA